MPKQKKPIDSGLTGPVAEFAQELRDLRKRAGNPSYDSMAKIGFSSKATLSTADRGDKLATREATKAYLKGCRCDDLAISDWLTRREDVARLARELEGREPRSTPPPESAAGTQPPGPGDAATPAALRARFRALHAWAGSPSYRKLSDRAKRRGLRLPPSTIGDLLADRDRPSLPRPETVEAFLTACGLHGVEHNAWLANLSKILADRRSLPTRRPPDRSDTGIEARPATQTELVAERTIRKRPPPTESTRSPAGPQSGPSSTLPRRTLPRPPTPEPNPRAALVLPAAPPRPDLLPRAPSRQDPDPPRRHRSNPVKPSRPRHRRPNRPAQPSWQSYPTDPRPSWVWPSNASPGGIKPTAQLLRERDDWWAVNPFEQEPAYERGVRESRLAVIVLVFLLALFGLAFAFSITAWSPSPVDGERVESGTEAPDLGVLVDLHRRVREGIWNLPEAIRTSLSTPAA